jgi:hypothetical protein
MAVLPNRDRPQVSISTALLNYLDHKGGGVFGTPGKFFWELAGEPEFRSRGIESGSLRNAASRLDRSQVLVYADNKGYVYAVTLMRYAWTTADRNFLHELKKR